MIIECINCNKKFNVNSEQIPDEGRTIQCGSCNHVWFFEKKSLDEIRPSNLDYSKKDNNIKKVDKLIKIAIEKDYEENSEIINKKSNFTVNSLLSYIIVSIISFIGFILILDTFKSPLYKTFPNLEFLLFSFYETLKDLNLFMRDLI
jgi:predicted Zn finger-like uncharacterized protein